MKFTLCLLLASLLPFSTLFAGSATWRLDPVSRNWSTADNWTPATVPNGPDDTATFDVSSVTEVVIKGSISVNSIVFNPGASAYTITSGIGPGQGGGLFITGAGIVNNSGITQNFVFDSYSTVSAITGGTAGTLTNFIVVSGGGPRWLEISGTASAGSATFTTEGSKLGATGGFLLFSQSATGGNSMVTNDGSTVSGELKGGVTSFLDDSTAGDAIITNKAGVVTDGHGGFTFFSDTSSAGNAILTNEGASVSGALGGTTHFIESSNAGAATLVATAGSNGGHAGGILFLDHSQGGTARVEVFGGGYLDIRLADTTVTIGSIEGDGVVFVGANNLTTGASNLSTTFAGVIQDGGAGGGTGGSVTKVGTGTLTLSGANTYTGGTTISKGTLFVKTNPDSGTGTAKVAANTGTLGGTGTIGGAVTIGKGNESGAFLSPGTNGIGTLTMKDTLTFKLDGTYQFELNSSNVKADKVIAKGVTIRSGAQFSVTDRGSGILTAGTTFTAIRNTAATPFSGTFANLPDGSTIKVGSNNFQVSYEGGNGNDLTLTVVP